MERDNRDKSASRIGKDHSTYFGDTQVLNCGDLVTYTTTQKDDINPALIKSVVPVLFRQVCSG